MARGRRDDRPIPPHPYRDTALVYGGMGLALVIVATLTGGSVVKASIAALAFFTIATAWTWWRFRIRIKERDAALAAEAAAAAGGKRGPANGNGRGGGPG